MQSSQHGDRGNCGASKLGRDVLGDTGKAQNIDVQHLTGSPRRFEILAAVVPQTEVQTFSGRGLFDDVCVTLELVADCRSNEIGTVRVEMDVFWRLSSVHRVRSDLDNPSRQVRTFRDLFLITELLDSKAESDDVGFEAELAWMSRQIEGAFRFIEVLKKAAADPSNRSSIDPPLFRLSRSGSNS